MPNYSCDRQEFYQAYEVIQSQLIAKDNHMFQNLKVNTRTQYYQFSFNIFYILFNFYCKNSTMSKNIIMPLTPVNHYSRLNQGQAIRLFEKFLSSSNEDKVPFRTKSCLLGGENFIDASLFVSICFGGLRAFDLFEDYKIDQEVINTLKKQVSNFSWDEHKAPFEHFQINSYKFGKMYPYYYQNVYQKLDQNGASKILKVIIKQSIFLYGVKIRRWNQFNKTRDQKYRELKRQNQDYQTSRVNGVTYLLFAQTNNKSCIFGMISGQNEFDSRALSQNTFKSEKKQQPEKPFDVLVQEKKNWNPVIKNEFMNKNEAKSTKYQKEQEKKIQGKKNNNEGNLLKSLQEKSKQFQKKDQEAKKYSSTQYSQSFQVPNMQKGNKISYQTTVQKKQTKNTNLNTSTNLNTHPKVNSKSIKQSEEGNKNSFNSRVQKTRKQPQKINKMTGSPTYSQKSIKKQQQQKQRQNEKKYALPQKNQPKKQDYIKLLNNEKLQPSNKTIFNKNNQYLSQTKQKQLKKTQQSSNNTFSLNKNPYQIRQHSAQFGKKSTGKSQPYGIKTIRITEDPRKQKQKIYIDDISQKLEVIIQLDENGIDNKIFNLSLDNNKKMRTIQINVFFQKQR